MPGATPIYAIPYPCSGENIDCTVFEAFADAVQAAVTSTGALETQALNRPRAQAVNTTQGGFVAAAPTNVTYATENFDNDAIINLAVDNTAFTATTGGWYLVSFQCDVSFSVGVTSFSVALSQNGTVVYRHKYSPPPTNQVTPGQQVIGLFSCAPGDIIRAVFLYAGAPSPTVRTATINGYLVSQA